MTKKKLPSGIKIITDNRKARHNYELTDNFEAGIVLLGSEVKSIRSGKAHLNEAYGSVRQGELFLMQSHIAPYQAANYSDHEPQRARKLLLHRHEIERLIGKIQEKGLTLVPLKMYFKKGRVKVELALGRSKKKVDKRQTIKKRETDRQLQRIMKQARK